MDSKDFELANALFGSRESTKGASYRYDAEARSDSESGRVRVAFGGDAVTGDGLQEVDVDTSVSVKSGQRVVVTVTDGSPMVTDVVGWGDEANKKINSANETAERTAWYFWSDSEGAHVATTKGDAKTGSNILITGSNIELRDGESVLATFNKSLIELGKNSPSAVIKLCNELGEIGVVTTAASSMLALFGANVGVKGNESATLASSGSHATAIGDNLMLSANDMLALASSTIAVGKSGSKTTVTSPDGNFTSIYEPNSGALSLFAKSIVLADSPISDRGFGITSDNAFRVTTPYVSVGTDDLVPVAYVSHALEPVELFTTDSVVLDKGVTLSETAANFQQLDVWFETDDHAQGFVSVVDPDQKIFTAATNFYQGKNMYVKSKTFFVNGTDVNTYENGMYKTGIWSSDGMNAFGDYIGIKRVVGWRKRY